MFTLRYNSKANAEKWPIAAHHWPAHLHADTRNIKLRCDCKSYADDPAIA